MNILAFIFSLLLFFSLFFHHSNSRMHEIWMVEKSFFDQGAKKRKDRNRRIEAKYKNLKPKEKKEDDKSNTPKKDKNRISLNLFSFSEGQNEELMQFFQFLLEGLYPEFWEEIEARHFAQEIASAIYKGYEKGSSFHIANLRLSSDKYQRLFYYLMRSPDKPFSTYFHISAKQSKICLHCLPLYYLELLFGKKIATTLYKKDEPFPCSLEEIDEICMKNGKSFIGRQFLTSEHSRKKGTISWRRLPH